MKFRIDQIFSADISSVCHALVDGRYLGEGMAKLPDIGAPRVELQTRSGALVHQQVRYSFQGSLPGAVTMIISPSKLSWIEDATIDTSSYRATFTMTPIHYKQFFRCTGEWTLSEIGSGGLPRTQRRIEGTLKVNSPVPFTGGEIEKAIFSGLKERLALEPAVLDAWVLEQQKS